MRRPNDLLVAINGFDVGNGYTSQMQALDIIKEAGLRLVLVSLRADLDNMRSASKFIHNDCYPPQYFSDSFS